ncbi:MAG: M20/M25/M40 family metallo-hydrolase [Candidatus Binataceae bacterium]|nr:M20/M25/M40 family metallo-hydrolase [Candidatus Binataceae bacterium]
MRRGARQMTRLRAAAAGLALALAATFSIAMRPVARADDRQLVDPAPRPKAIDYGRLTQEATALLQTYIRLDTTNPPGDELEAARMLKQKFLADGIPATVWEPAPGRGVVAARLHGSGRHQKAIVLLSHMDVVPANPKEWQVPPFAAQIKDGDIWGRGALDDKGPGVIELMAMLAIKRAGILLDRDVVFIATGDEEEGGKLGAGWMVDHHADVFADAGALLNEGGGIDTRPNGRRYFDISLSEKTPLWLRLTATGDAGHAAVPPAATAVTRLIRALGQIAAYQPPMRIVAPVRDYFRAIGELDGGPPQFANLAVALRDPDFAKKFVAVPRQNALVRDTFTPTVLTGSPKTNIIPASASAEIDGRLLPGEDPQAIVAGLRKVIGDPGIKVDVTLNFPAESSPRKSAMMTALGQLADSEHCALIPSMIAGFTDSHYFRQKGIDCYGFVPIEVPAAALRGVHGINERIPVKELGAGIRRMVALLEIIGRRPPRAARGKR